MTKKAFLICFIGMDGTGKTTQAKRLVNALEARGIKCKYVWNTYQPFITKPFLLMGKALFFRGKDAFKDYAEYSSTKTKVFRTPILSRVYEYLSLFDYLCQSLVTVRLPRMFGSNIICDRYVQDVAVNLAAELGYSDEKLRSRLGKLRGWLPKPDLTFLMDVPEETGFQRKDDTPSIEHLRSLRGIYLSIGKGCGAVMLDGAEDPAELESVILDKVNQATGWSENPTIALLRIIDTPLAMGTERFTSGAHESRGLYQFAVKNKISLLYLNALDRHGKLNELKPEYEEQQAKYPIFLEAIARVASILDAAGVEYVVFKTIKPYPALPSDIDVMVLDNQYKESIRALLKVGYTPLLSEVINTAALTSEGDYEKAAEILCKSTYGKTHVSPTGSTFIDNERNVHIDLQKDLAVSYVIYMDKSKFTQHLISTGLPNGIKVKTLAPELDLATVIAHSLMEQTYSLGEFYTFSHYLSDMDEKKVSNFINIVKENRLKSALRTLATITAELHKAAYGKVPESLKSILTEVGFDASEAKNLERNNFRMPHKYKALTVIKFLLEKLGEPRFRKSALTQVIKMLNPNLTKLVIRELIGMRRRENYLKEAG